MMMKSNAIKQTGEEVKYSLDWTSKIEVAQPPFYKRPTLFMLVCTAKRNKSHE